MNTRAGERLQGLRELTGLTQAQFAEMLDINYVRLRNIEQKKARMAEDEFAKIGALLPEFIFWLTFEGDINMDDLKNSTENLCKLAAAKIEAGQIPKGYHLEDKIK
ncbi:MAG: helix-turn-helix transcriptional regulator [Pseudomonadales bacterium]|nr:helix-turn-helix transcriptional regulator [Pseudomonadales bacterium]